MEIFYTVYKTTNNETGMYYIGVHKTNDINDSYLGSGVWLKRAIKKHGRTCFTKQILYIFDNPVDAFNKEMELLTNELIDSKVCYNLMPGGYGGWTDSARKKALNRNKELWETDQEWVKQQIEKRKTSAKNRFNDSSKFHFFKLERTTEWKEIARKRNLGKKLSAQTKQKISNSLKMYYKNNEARVGLLNEEIKEKIRKKKLENDSFKRTSETRKKMSEKRKGVPKTEEHRKKISESLKRNSQNKRQILQETKTPINTIDIQE